MKISGKEHIYTFVGHIDPITGKENLQELLALMDRRYKVSFYPGSIIFRHRVQIIIIYS
jgi:hypothetical protein